MVPPAHHSSEPTMMKALSNPVVRTLINVLWLLLLALGGWTLTTTVARIDAVEQRVVENEIQSTDRLARIETKLDTLLAHSEEDRK